MTIEQLSETIKADIRDARNELRADIHRMEDGFTKWQTTQDARLHEHEQHLADHHGQLSSIHVKTGVSAAFFGCLGAAVAAVGLWLARLKG